jgi:transcriptional regulator with XRE-family HTH domain
MDDELASRLASNVKQLRQARGLTQQKMAKLAGMPRATWANLESGAANPTLSVLRSVALALEVPLEELIATPRADVKLFKKGSLPSRTRSKVVVSSLLPEDLPNTQIERFDMPGHARMIGVPHTPGTREYLTCETGEIELTAGGETYRLAPGDLVVFRGDQRHSYFNPGARTAVGYSVVLLKPM